ncbi:hypothetical protein AMAG_05361 [Allomyces macrogynus ATCC 38327]|uniref:BZIP domain-containing protein n=1 Tax=Allomyces macrogynus (strain ATCC 38327) TaxID=578462 RepID=A0A0L0SBU6_ALLM3|nr:hypothetical protein AMAG_05361 [Allomyces macrogynus ATCC 38327]|eukprot:KNE59912.1 hypothetical protein AMAG_05361 [Allomyces macrogynus ATCC 38327]
MPAATRAQSSLSAICTPTRRAATPARPRARSPPCANVSSAKACRALEPLLHLSPSPPDQPGPILVGERVLVTWSARADHSMPNSTPLSPISPLLLDSIRSCPAPNDAMAATASPDPQSAAASSSRWPMNLAATPVPMLGFPGIAPLPSIPPMRAAWPGIAAPAAAAMPFVPTTSPGPVAAGAVPGFTVYWVPSAAVPNLVYPTGDAATPLPDLASSLGTATAAPWGLAQSMSPPVDKAPSSPWAMPSLPTASPVASPTHAEPSRLPTEPRSAARSTSTPLTPITVDSTSESGSQSPSPDPEATPAPESSASRPKRKPLNIVVPPVPPLMEKRCKGGPGKKRKGISAEEKEARKQERVMRNRIAAQESRNKKRAWVEALETTTAELQDENAALVKANERLHKRVKLLEDENKTLNSRLDAIMAEISAMRSGEASVSVPALASLQSSPASTAAATASPTVALDWMSPPLTGAFDASSDQVDQALDLSPWLVPDAAFGAVPMAADAPAAAVAAPTSSGLADPSLMSSTLVSVTLDELTRLLFHDRAPGPAVSEALVSANRSLQWKRSIWKVEPWVKASLVLETWMACVRTVHWAMMVWVAARVVKASSSLAMASSRAEAVSVLRARAEMACGATVSGHIAGCKTTHLTLPYLLSSITTMFSARLPAALAAGIAVSTRPANLRTCAPSRLAIVALSRKFKHDSAGPASPTSSTVAGAASSSASAAPTAATSTAPVESSDSTAPVPAATAVLVASASATTASVDIDPTTAAGSAAAPSPAAAVAAADPAQTHPTADPSAAGAAGPVRPNDPDVSAFHASARASVSVFKHLAALRKQEADARRQWTEPSVQVPPRNTDTRLTHPLLPCDHPLLFDNYVALPPFTTPASPPADPARIFSPLTVEEVDKETRVTRAVAAATALLNHAQFPWVMNPGSPLLPMKVALKRMPQPPPLPTASGAPQAQGPSKGVPAADDGKPAMQLLTPAGSMALTERFLDSLLESSAGGKEHEQGPAPVRRARATMFMTSVLRKRRKKMNKHKLRKLRKRTRSERK